MNGETDVNKHVRGSFALLGYRCNPVGGFHTYRQSPVFGKKKKQAKLWEKANLQPCNLAITYW